MNFLKIVSVGLVIGLSLLACKPEECYECIASDKNGIGDPVSDEICDKDDLPLFEKTNFRDNFETQHDTVFYDIICRSFDK